MRTHPRLCHDVPMTNTEGSHLPASITNNGALSDVAQLWLPGAEVLGQEAAAWAI